MRHAADAARVGTLLLMYLTGIPLILVHELAHGWAALRRTGARAEVQVGLGPKLASVPAGPFDLCLALLPFGGHCRWQPTDRTTPRDHAFVAAAGPAATFACFVVLVAWWWEAGAGPLLLGAATGSAGVMFLTSALPVRYGSILPAAPVSDGLVVWQSLARERRRDWTGPNGEPPRPPAAGSTADDLPVRGPGWDTSRSYGPPRAGGA